MVQWLRRCTSTAGGAGSISGQGTKILHAMQTRQKKKKNPRLVGESECQEVLLAMEDDHEGPTCKEEVRYESFNGLSSQGSQSWPRTSDVCQSPFGMEAK